MTTKKDDEIIGRLSIELRDLNDRVKKLREFIGGSEFSNLTSHHKQLLARQFASMCQYRFFIIERANDLAAGDFNE